MMVLGCDPGATTGLVVLDCSLPTPIVETRIAVQGEELAERLRELCVLFVPDVLAIELPSQVFTHGRAREGMGTRVSIEQAVIAARGTAGRVRGVVETLCNGVRVFEAEAHEVRRAVLGAIPRAPRGTDPRQWIDDIVRQRVPLLVTGWKKGAGDNDHNRDACVVGLWGSRTARLPAALVQTKAPRRAARKTRRAA